MRILVHHFFLFQKFYGLFYFIFTRIGMVNGAGRMGSDLMADSDSQKPTKCQRKIKLIILIKKKKKKRRNLAV